MKFPKVPMKYKLYDESIIHEESLWTINNAHDPASFKDGDTYYVFSTDAKYGGPPTGGIQIRKSRDLIHWEFVGHAFDQIPAEAHEWTGAKGLWAPEVVKFGDTYYMYYAASQFGKNQSFIGVATSSHIEGPWEDQGEVVKSKQGDLPNAIDPNITFDEDGNPWMVYGSFFGGMFVFRIDPATGKKLAGSEEKLIAKRHESVEAAIEGPYIVYHPEFKKYYLFVSYDSLFKNYNIRVGRADHIEGPYVDFNGNEMTDLSLPPNDVGMKILGGYKFGDSEGWIAPGHNSVLKDGDSYFIVHHARGEKDPHWHYLHVRKIVWSEDGWPLVSPERYAGEEETEIDPTLMEGAWEYIQMDKDQNEQLHSRSIELGTDTKAGRGKGSCRYIKGNQFELFLNENGRERKEEIIVLPAWDWENWVPTLVFAGKDEHGEVIIGKKVVPVTEE
ncbi:arabinan endo-1,5-alpha-L-arabinosidase [Mesobacillus foraminis]|uniref:arabinan endo-1,5-alpha-L-arabinosidase n=1 Tax=Mesobacillus foraminis TaxID=279826 RepID=UPI000EF55415|nr:arabinan endo-1,5-alpha-L-arabinosidase [Mesobacillus foraminis]